MKRQERRSGQLAARQPASGCAWLGLLRPRCWIPGMLVSRTEPMDRIRRRKGQLKLVRACPVSSVHGRDGPCKRRGREVEAQARVLAREASQPARGEAGPWVAWPRARSALHAPNSVRSRGRTGGPTGPRRDKSPGPTRHIPWIDRPPPPKSNNLIIIVI